MRHLLEAGRAPGGPELRDEPGFSPCTAWRDRSPSRRWCGACRSGARAAISSAPAASARSSPVCWISSRLASSAIGACSLGRPALATSAGRPQAAEQQHRRGDEPLSHLTLLQVSPERVARNWLCKESHSVVNLQVTAPGSPALNESPDPIFPLDLKRSPLQARNRIRGLHQEIGAAILGGRLARGLPRYPRRGRWPSISASHRNTVVAVCELLLNEGYIVSRTGQGAFVSQSLARAEPPASAATGAGGQGSPRTASGETASPSRLHRPGPKLNFRVGTPDVGLFPRGVWRSLVNREQRAIARERRGHDEPMGRARAARRRSPPTPRSPAPSPARRTTWWWSAGPSRGSTSWPRS